jgi:hypothetical protein
MESSQRCCGRYVSLTQSLYVKTSEMMLCQLLPTDCRRFASDESCDFQGHLQCSVINTRCQLGIATPTTYSSNIAAEPPALKLSL